MEYVGKLAVVTGVSYGLGKDICIELLNNKYKVYGISRTKPKITFDKFVWINADLVDPRDLKRIPSEIKESRVDLLINNAGTVILEKALDLSEKAFDQTFDLNFKAPIKIASLLKNKLKHGLIINISSTSDRFAEENYGLYCASKAALGIFFDAVAVENKDIKVIDLLPTYMDTPLQNKLVKGLSFDWNLAMNTKDVAIGIIEIVKNVKMYTSKTKIIVVSDKTVDDTKDEEILWYYNVDNKKFKKLK